MTKRVDAAEVSDRLRSAHPERLGLWQGPYRSICRRYPDLVAVYESPSGRLAMLLRHPLVPRFEERTVWRLDVKHSAQAIIAGLRTAGLDPKTSIMVLQGRPPQQVTRVLRHWACRYDGQEPHWEAQISPPIAGGGDPPNADSLLVDGLTLWYHDMAPCWLSVDPLIRRRLMLRTHRWLVERVIATLAEGERLPIEDLVPTGPLAWLLVRVVPQGELDSWKSWIRLLLADLRRALAWPEPRRTEAWVRWLFLIPYGLPTRSKPLMLAKSR